MPRHYRATRATPDAPANPHERAAQAPVATMPAARSDAATAPRAGVAASTVGQMRALQDAVGNRAAQRVMGARQAPEAHVHAAETGTVQRKKNPERERLERIRMWGLLFEQNGIDVDEAAQYANAFANASVSAATVLAFARPLHEDWHAEDVIGLINEYCADDLGRPLEVWVGLAVRGDDLDEVSEDAKAGVVNWANAPAVFYTHNDRYQTTRVDLVGAHPVYHLQGGVAVSQTVDLPDGEEVFEVTGGKATFHVRGDLRALTTSDSRYTVTPGGYTRYAPVNMVESPAQVNFQETRHFCYLPAGSEVYDTVLGNDDDSDFHVTAIDGGKVVWDIAGDEFHAPIAPRNGYTPFDFDYDASDGSIAHGHPGHTLYGLR